MASNTIDFTIHLSFQPRKGYKVTMNREELTLDNLIKKSNEILGIKNGKYLYLDNGKKCEEKHLENINNYDDIHLHLSDGTILESSHEIIHICMLGAGAVGKSALTLHYIQGQFVPDYDPTIEDAYRKPIDIDGTNLMLDILDTAGQEDFVALRTTWMRNKEGFVLVFSVVDRNSFDDLESFYEHLNDVYDDNIPPIILVGNKIDLDPKFKFYNANLTGHGDLNYKREVSIDEALNLAKKWNCVRYIETSAKIGYKVSDIFGQLVRDIISSKIESQMVARNEKPEKPNFFHRGFCTLL